MLFLVFIICIGDSVEQPMIQINTGYFLDFSYWQPMLHAYCFYFLLVLYYILNLIGYVLLFLSLVCHYKNFLIIWPVNIRTQNLNFKFSIKAVCVCLKQICQYMQFSKCQVIYVVVLMYNSLSLIMQVYPEIL